jgi:hypothetical protein
MTGVISRPGAVRDDGAVTNVEIPLHPKNPDRTCWGCDKYCPADDLACGNGTIRTPHPVELFGDDWDDWSARRSNDARHTPAAHTLT